MLLKITFTQPFLKPRGAYGVCFDVYTNVNAGEADFAVVEEFRIGLGNLN